MERVGCQVVPFVGISVVIVEFLPAVVVLDESPTLRSHGVIPSAERSQHRARPFPCRVFQKRNEAFSVEVGSLGNATEFEQRRVKVDQADWPVTQFSAHEVFWHVHDESGSSGGFP